MLCLTHRVRFGRISVKSVPHIALVKCLSLKNSYAILASSKVVFLPGGLIMKCSNCGTQLPPGAVACPMCGTPTPQYGFGSGATPYDPTIASSYNTHDTPLSATPPPAVHTTPQPTTTANSSQNPYPPNTGTLVLNDPLTDNSRGYKWDESSFSGTGTCGFTGGAYHINVQKAGLICIAEAKDLVL